MHSWLPRSVECFRSYSLRTFGRDALAGITVALVALPLAMAFAIASGVPPQAGLYTAIVAGFLISALGGSRVQIGGPTGAFVVVIAGVIAKFGLNGLALAGIMSGLILVAGGLTGIGRAVKYIPRPVIIGFTNGIALLIASTQIKDFFGLRVDHVPSAFFARMSTLAAHAGSVAWPALAIAAATLAVIVLWPRVTTRIPGSVIAIALATITTVTLHIDVATIGSTFGGIPQGLPPFTPPHWQPELIGALVPSACTLAFLAGVESLLSAVVADTLTGDRHSSDVEIVAQGIANIATPFFGGIPATGAIARTATNIRAGGQTPMAGIIHAAVLLVILLVAAPYARFIPLAALAAVLMNVAYHMGEWHQIGAIVRLSKTDIAVWLTTFALTAFVDLTVAIGVGMTLAALVHIYRVGETTAVELLHDPLLPRDVSCIRISGPMLFGATDKLDALTADIDRFGRFVVLDLRQMPALDATGVYAFDRLGLRLRASGRSLLLCAVAPQPARILNGSHFLARNGANDVTPDLPAALAIAAARRSQPGEASVATLAR